MIIGLQKALNTLIALKILSPLDQTFTNCSLLAISVPVCDCWDSQCEAINWDIYSKYKEEMCQGLSKILGKPAAHYEQLLNAVAKEGVSFVWSIFHTQYKDLKDLPSLETEGIRVDLYSHGKDRRKPFNQLAGRTIGIDRNDRRVGIDSLGIMN